MLKRPRDPHEHHAPSPKRQCHHQPQDEHPHEDRIDRLSQLSDELLLRIFSHLSVSCLSRCQRLSHKLHAIAGDSQLWRAAYYQRFVRPRTARLARSSAAREQTSLLLSQQRDGVSLSSKLSRWLDEECLLRRGRETNWKRQYKLRHNWAKGSCGVSEIQVAEAPPPVVPPLLVRLQDGIVFTADSVAGLRAWEAKGERRLLARVSMVEKGSGDAGSSPHPTAMAVDANCGEEGSARVLVGFEDGRFTLYGLRVREREFCHLYSHAPSSNGGLSAVAFSSPYLLTMTATELLSVYKLPPGDGGDKATEPLKPPHLLYSLKSHTAWQPLSLSIRWSQRHVIASVAYALPTYLSGWTVGLQELCLSSDGELLDSRIASATDDTFRPLLSLSAASSPNTRTTSPAAGIARGAGYSSRDNYSKPTSLSYTHPYLLVSHPDNTLTLYLVTSTAKRLSISSGSRLWGHTSSVSGAHIGGRGKAVSVSSKGDELRVWELEGGLLSSVNRKHTFSEEFSVQVRPEQRRTSDFSTLDLAAKYPPNCGSGLALVTGRKWDDANISRGWLGFDEENVVVLRENSQGAQALIIYDFT